MSLRYVMRGAMQGKSLGRLLMNDALESVLGTLRGNVLDLAGGAGASYLPFIPKSVRLVRTNVVASEGVVAVDFNKPLPFPDDSFDAILMINAIYIVEDPVALLADARRILKPGGTCVFVSPFIANEMPEPHDYVRFTAEGLERICERAGLHHPQIDRLGERASAAMYILSPFIPFRWLRAVTFPLALLCDRMIPARVRLLHPTPISYLVHCKK